MTAVIACLSITAYLAAGVLPGRLVWARYRPNSEPVHCRNWTNCWNGRHDQACYRHSEVSLVDAGEAAAMAIGGALLWPVLAPLLTLGWLIMRKPRFRREELEAKVARMERELQR